MKADGKRYEALVGKKLLLPLTKTEGFNVRHSVWFEFIDANGRGHCEADYLVFTPISIYVIEVKLTQTPRGLTQLQDLYLPVARQVFQNTPVYGVMVCKTLWIEPDNLATSWNEVKSYTNPDALITWHWLGR